LPRLGESWRSAAGNGGAMNEFDHDRFQPVMNYEEFEYAQVYPYAFWFWEVGNGLKGGMVCFRGECRANHNGKKDVLVIQDWMDRYFQEVDGIRGLVVDTWEFFGEWHDDLAFLPSIVLPDDFKVLYSVLPHYKERALELWGRGLVRDNLEVALAEMDHYLLSLSTE